MQGDPTVRLRVHNLLVSSDGYAARDYMTFEKQSGGAKSLFGRFDGHVIHGIDVPLPWIGPCSVCVADIGAEIIGRRKFGLLPGE